VYRCRFPIHPSSDDSPLPFAALWYDKAIRAHCIDTDAVPTRRARRHRTLAGRALHLEPEPAARSLVTPRGMPCCPPTWFHGQPASTHHGHGRTLRDLLRCSRRARRASQRVRPRYVSRHGYLPYDFYPEYITAPTDAPIETACAWGAGTARGHPRCGGDKCGVPCASVWGSCVQTRHQSPSEAQRSRDACSARLPILDVKMESIPTDCAPSRFRRGRHEPSSIS